MLENDPAEGHNTNSRLQLVACMQRVYHCGMKLRKLPSVCITPLRLKDVTLRGIGSYRQPARLEIRPITILCGPNGCGKSTWIKVLNLLQTTAREGCLTSWDLQAAATKAHIVVLNLDWPTVQVDNRERIAQPEWDAPCGPYGTIGLTWVCTKRVPLAPLPCDTECLPASLRPLFEATSLKIGTEVTLRLTLGVTFDSGYSPSAMRLGLANHAIEVRAPSLKSAEWSVWLYEAGSESHCIGCYGADEPPGKIKLIAAAIISRATELGRLWQGTYFHVSAVRQVHDGSPEWFDAEKSEGSPPVDLQRTVLANRYVGASGEHTHVLRGVAGPRPILDPRPGRPALACELINPGADGIVVPEGVDFEGAWAILDRVTERSPHGEALKEPAIWSLLRSVQPAAWDQFVGFFRRYAGQLPPDLADLIELGVCVVGADRCGDFGELAGFFTNRCSLGALWPPPTPPDPAVTPLEASDMVAATTPTPDPDTPVGRLFAELNTGRPITLGHLHEDLSPETIAAATGPRANYLQACLALEKALRKLTEDDVACAAIADQVWNRTHPSDGNGFHDPHTFSTLLGICRAQGRPADVIALRHFALCELGLGGYSINHSEVLSVNAFCSYWLARIADVHACAWDLYRCDDGLLDVHKPVAGYMTTLPEVGGDRAGLQYANDFVEGDLAPLPASFSTGFHQVAPIVMQFGVMRMNEICAVENPEVHLHPGAQLRVGEFFIENARIGKFALIETHSDLMIRRVLRAIGEEQIRQSWVNITFVSKREEERFWTAVAEPLKMDRRGRIVNWPAGFLDDDEKESMALLRAMYGSRIDETQEQDDDDESR